MLGFMIYKYILAFFVLTLFSVSSDKKTAICRSQSGYAWSLTLCSLIVLAFLVGVNEMRADFVEYLDFFRKSPLLFSDGFLEYAMTQHTEIGYNCFQAFVKMLFHSPTAWFIIFCFVSFAFRYSFYREFVPLADIGIVFFAFFSQEFLRKDCVQIRNGFASSLVLYSLVFLYKESRGKFVATVLFAACFQSTALVALPLVVVRTENSKKYESFLCLFFLCGIVVALLFPVKKVFFFFEDVGVLPKGIATYLYWSDYAKPMSLTNPMLVKQIFLSVWIIRKRKKWFCDRCIFFLGQIYLVSTVYYLVFRDFEILAGRFGSLFYAVEAPLLLLMIKKSNRHIVIKKLFVYGFYFCFFLYNMLSYQDVLGWRFRWY